MGGRFLSSMTRIMTVLHGALNLKRADRTGYDILQLGIQYSTQYLYQSSVLCGSCLSNKSLKLAAGLLFTQTTSN
jgi:hypothetical protein